MSIKFMTKVWQIDELEPNQKLVFLSICDNANDEGICYPSIDTIQNKTSISRPTVIKIINRLVELNYLMKTQRARKSGGRYSSLYLVFPLENIDKLDDEYKQKFSQSKEALLVPKVKSESSQSKMDLPSSDTQSKGALPEPSLSLFNHHLFKEMKHNTKELYLEYISLRKKMKLITTIKTHDNLLNKFFEFGGDDNIIVNAINANWKDFYAVKSSSKQSYIDRCINESARTYEAPVDENRPF